jgi:CHAD domain-containing protein
MSVEKKTTQRLFTRFDTAIKHVAKSPDAEHVHHLRTNARRIEALLTNENIDGNAKLLKELKRYRKRAGKVRDLDVQMAALKTLQIEGHYDQKQAVMSALQRQRTRKAKKLVTLVEDSHHDSRRRLAKVQAKLLDRGADGAASLNYYQAAFDIFRVAVDKVEANGGFKEPAKLHRFRLDAKKVRYTAEMAGNNKEAKALVKEMERLQDAIGDWHDWQVLSETAADELSAVHTSALISILQNIVGAKFATAVRIASEVTDRLLQRPARALAKKAPASAQAPARTQRLASGS